MINTSVYICAPPFQMMSLFSRIVRKMLSLKYAIREKMRSIFWRVYYTIFRLFHPTSEKSRELVVYSLFGYYDKGDLPPLYKKNIAKWKSCNPQSTVKVLNYHHDNIPDLITSFGKGYEEVFSLFEKNPTYAPILKCDFTRYILSYEYGWSYTDLDVHPRISLETLWKRYPKLNVILGLEWVFNPSAVLALEKSPIHLALNQSKHPYTISNYAFFCKTPHHPFFKDVIEGVKFISQRLAVTSDDHVLYVTGPELMTRFFWENSKRYEDVGVLSYEEFHKLFPTSYTNSWMKKTSSENLS